MRDDDSIYYDTYNEGPDEEEKPSGAKRIIKIVFRAFFLTLLISILTILIFRIISMKEPRRVSGYSVTQSTLDALGKLDAYHRSNTDSEKYPDEEYILVDRDLGFVTVKNKATGEETRVRASEYDERGFAVYTQKLYNYSYTDPETGATTLIKRDEYYTDPASEDGTARGLDETFDGCYRVSNMYFTPASNNLQVTFRYSGRSGIAKLMYEYGLREEPKGEVFVFTLSDDLGNEYTDYSYRTDSRSYYQYRSLVFEGVDFDSVKEFTLNVYYVADVKIGEPFVSMVIYDENLVLKKSDVEVGNKLSGGLKDAPKYAEKY